MESFLMWVECANKSSETRQTFKTLLCAVTKGGVLLQICKCIISHLLYILHLAVHGHNHTPPVVTAKVAAVGLSSHGL